MHIKDLLNEDIRAFIQNNADQNVAALALKKPPNPDWPYALILDQIKARQKSAHKIPLWLEQDTLLFPPSGTIEQASSQTTARYKSDLVSGREFIDLTAGAGIDSFAFIENFETGHCVEADANTLEILRHNASILYPEKLKIHRARAEEFVKKMPECDLVYLDPQRRTQNQKGRFHFKDCIPDPTALLADIFAKALVIMIKASPMLDIKAGFSALPQTKALHVVEYDGDCKELLFILEKGLMLSPESIPVSVARLDTKSGYKAEITTHTIADENKESAVYSQPQSYIYEPGPAYQKAAFFKSLCRRFKVCKLHTQTHLMTSEHYSKEFPGRHFRLIDILPFDSKALPVDKGHLAVRNFPSSVQALRKQLKLKEGGEAYFFASTLSDDKKALLYCEKISP